MLQLVVASSRWRQSLVQGADVLHLGVNKLVNIYSKTCTICDP